MPEVAALVVATRHDFPEMGPPETFAWEYPTELHDAGFMLIVVTNQPDVARGTITKAEVEEIDNHFADHQRKGSTQQYRVHGQL